ncbi:spore coat protein CotJB [Metabacillus sp. RGM 3146]|uniref:spore coat protein CotJB n=1 Tax=Metabacillus sp. RGM 3146 TaxID=3401092 RepID=UPI003B9D29B1
MAQALPKEYYEELEKIQAVDFVIAELILYLDTHPNDSNAIRQYNQFAQYSRSLKQQFEAKFGPLQQGSPNYNENDWAWQSCPWPWQV